MLWDALALVFMEPAVKEKVDKDVNVEVDKDVDEEVDEKVDKEVDEAAHIHQLSLALGRSYTGC